MLASALQSVRTIGRRPKVKSNFDRRSRLIMTLAALLAVTTGAWAQGPTVWTIQPDVGQLHEGDILAEVSSLASDIVPDLINIRVESYKKNDVLQTLSSDIKFSAISSFGENCVISAGSDTYAPVDEYGDDGNAWVVTYVFIDPTRTDIWLSGIYYDPNGVALTTNDNRTVWTIDKMPAADVELTVRYYDDAKVEGTATAATGVRVGEDKALVTDLTAEGGTLVYAITAATVTTPPADDQFAAANNTAKGITEAGTYRVWYFAAGDATHSPSDPVYTDVAVLTNKFDLTFTAANANTIDGTKATVSVKDGETVIVNEQALGDDGKLAAVTMGQTVILTAKEGYKIVGSHTKKAGETWVYNGPVAISALQENDILVQGFSLMGGDEDGIGLEGDRHTCNGYVEPSYIGGSLKYITSYGENCSFTSGGVYTYAPYDGSQVGNAWEVTAAFTTMAELSGITYTPLATINATKTVATMTMPACDVALSYDLRRDLSTETAVTVSIGGEQATTDTRLRIAKDGNAYKPVDVLTCSFADNITGVNITDPTKILPAGLNPQFYLQGDNDKWTLVTDINATTHLPTNIAPGQTYQMTLAALDASIYTGETPPTVSITLYEGYEVSVPAQEYITYFKDEALTLGADETAAKLYTITAVDGQTATATEVTVAKDNMPILVKNNSTETRNILLIPTTTATPDDVEAYSGFVGTLTATTIAASDATKNRYAFNGKQFVWVKNALAVGANKAWLEVPVNAGSNARAITLVFDNATGIANTDRTDLTDGDYYDLNGRKLNGLPTKKGVYVKNGKKVVVK